MTLLKQKVCKVKVEDVQWTNQFDLELDYHLESSIDEDEHLGHSKAQTNR